MKVYLVGGAVRDQLLGITPQERDWVVVGATPDQLIQMNFKQVGRDFPVFLHPKTKEEYALARTERKSAPGYYGFTCNSSASVTLEDDLLRRDFTVNAIAMDEEGRIIDPLQGQADLHNKIIRHVSPAFVEDPVRVLRSARFLARFHHLGFTLADETRRLMYSMVKRGELAYLVPERVWQEWQRSLTEANPEEFINTLRSCDALRVVFPELNDLFGVPNSPQYHHEVDSGVHSVLSLESAARLSTEPRVRFAALVHNLGKARSPIASWPKHPGHEERGVAIIESLCERLRIPHEYRRLATRVARHQQTIHCLFELSATKVVQLFDQCDAFRQPELFHDLLIACQADAEGCGGTIEYRQAPLWNHLLAECVKVNPKQLIEQGITGSAIKIALHQQRVACVDLILNSWKANEK